MFLHYKALLGHSDDCHSSYQTTDRIGFQSISHHSMILSATKENEFSLKMVLIWSRGRKRGSDNWQKARGFKFDVARWRFLWGKRFILDMFLTLNNLSSTFEAVFASKLTKISNRNTWKRCWITFSKLPRTAKNSTQFIEQKFRVPITF